MRAYVCVVQVDLRCANFLPVTGVASFLARQYVTGTIIELIIRSTQLGTCLSFPFEWEERYQASKAPKEQGCCALSRNFRDED